MKTSQSTTSAERAGRRLGRALFWIVKLSVFVVLLYSAFWLAMLLAFVVVAAWLVRNADLDEEKQPELRDGHSGVGLYAKDDWRIDMGDPDDL